MTELSQKLFDTRNFSGENQTEDILHRIRLVEHRLEGVPGFIGVKASGSLYRGYADFSRTSDVDLTVLVDTSIDSHVVSDVKRTCSDFEADQELKGRKFHFDFFDLADHLRSGHVDATDLRFLYAIFSKVSGTKINKYRITAKEWYSLLPQREKDLCFEGVINHFAHDEEGSMLKYVFRMHDHKYQNSNQRWRDDGYAIEDDLLDSARDGLWSALQKLRSLSEVYSAEARNLASQRTDLWRRRIALQLGRDDADGIE